MDRLKVKTVSHPARTNGGRVKFKSIPLEEYEPDGKTQATVERMHEPTDAYLRTVMGSDDALEALGGLLVQHTFWSDERCTQSLKTS